MLKGILGKSGLAGVAMMAGAFLVTTSAMAVDLDPKLDEYKAVSGVSGNIKSIGSDTLNNLMSLWSEPWNRTRTRRRS